MIVRHIFIKILIDFALPIHVLKRNQNYTSVSNIIFDVYISEIGLNDKLKFADRSENLHIYLDSKYNLDTIDK